MNKHMHFLLILLLSLTPLSAKAQDFTATYGIYTGGFHVVDLVATFKGDESSYDMSMSAKTIGLLGRLAPWGGDLETSGFYTQDAQPKPIDHSFASTWKGQVETTIFTYDEQGEFTGKAYIDEDGNESTDQYDPDLSAGTIDMLSALHQSLLNSRDHGKCDDSIPSFDGKRRYNMVFTSQGEGEIRKNRYSIYQGAAEICSIEIDPDGGLWREKPRGWMSLQGQAKGKGQLPRLWYADIDGYDMPIPVKFMIKTDYGTMLMHLRGLK